MQYVPGDHLVLLGGVAASGGALASNSNVEVDGFRIEPYLGVGGLLEKGRFQVIPFGTFKVNLSRTSFAQEALKTRQSFHALFGMQAGAMVAFMLNASWSLHVAAALTWFWQRYGYKDEQRDVEIFTSPWLEISTSLGAGYHF